MNDIASLHRKVLQSSQACSVVDPRKAKLLDIAALYLEQAMCSGVYGNDGELLDIREEILHVLYDIMVTRELD